MGNDIGSGPAMSVAVVYVGYTDLDNNFSNYFSLFQLESKSYRTKQCWPYIGYYIESFFGKNFIYKKLHIEPFNFSIKSVCFDFGSGNMGSSVIKTGGSEGSLLPYFYRFRCHYPLITYLRSEKQWSRANFGLIAVAKLIVKNSPFQN